MFWVSLDYSVKPCPTNKIKFKNPSKVEHSGKGRRQLVFEWVILCAWDLALTPAGSPASLFILPLLPLRDRLKTLVHFPTTLASPFATVFITLYT